MKPCAMVKGQSGPSSMRPPSTSTVPVMEIGVVTFTSPPAPGANRIVLAKSDAGVIENCRSDVPVSSVLSRIHSASLDRSPPIAIVKV